MNEQQQTTEVRETNLRDGATDVQRQTVTTADTADSRIVAKRVIWYTAGVIISLLALRVLLFLFGANRESGFVDFIYALSGIFAAPFTGIFAAPTYGQFFFDTASIIAIIVYALIAWGIAKLFTLNSARSDV